MAKTLRFARQNLNALVGIALVVALMATYLAKEPVSAHHEPANKFAAAGARPDEIAPDQDVILLEETIRVSSPFDLVITASAECSILTQVHTTASSDFDQAKGQVKMWVTIDGTTVPVSTVPADIENGKVTFCNRLHERNVANVGNSRWRDYEQTRNANSFTWFALDVGRDPVYDKNNDNLLDIELHGTLEFFTTATGQTNPMPCPNSSDDGPPPPNAGPTGVTCANAVVGARTLVVEPTNASVHEQVQTGPGTGN